MAAMSPPRCIAFALALGGAVALAPVASAQAPAAADPARTPDAAFVAKASETMAVDTELATLAVRRATSTDVRALARRVLEAREAITRDLKEMAGTRQLTGPASAAAPPAPTPAAALRSAPAATFDAAFLAALRANAERAVALFDAESRDGRDDEIKDWAARQLPALRDHLTALRTLRPRQGRSAPGVRPIAGARVRPCRRGSS